MTKTIKDYYINENFNCAEATIRAANDFYELKMSDEEMKLIAGFGGGMGCGLVCGCLTADIAVLSKLFVKEKAHESDRIKKLCSLFISEFEKKFGNLNCSELKTTCSEPETRCLKLIESNFELLKEFIKAAQKSMF